MFGGSGVEAVVGGACCRCPLKVLVQETRAQIWPNLAPEYICRFMIDSLFPDSSLFKSAGCETLNFGHLMLFAFEK